jgi:4-hydroxybenzoate polyprenyltransferase
MLEAAGTSEMLVNFYQAAWCKDAEGDHFNGESCIVMHIIAIALYIYKNLFLLFYSIFLCKCGFLAKLHTIIDHHYIYNLKGTQIKAHNMRLLVLMCCCLLCSAS